MTTEGTPPGKRTRVLDALRKRASTARIAEGSVVDPFELHSYRVVIEYREPTYAARAGPSAKTYRGTFRVEARSPASAEVLAREEFREMERLSSVGWAREIVRVTTVET